MAEIVADTPNPSRVGASSSMTSLSAADVVLVEEESGGEIEDDLKVKPVAANEGSRRRRRRKGWRLSLILNAVALGLGGWALARGWEEHVKARSVQFIGGLIVGAWAGLNMSRKYKKTKRLKYKMGRILDFNIGPRELRIMAGNTPFWVDFGRVEQASSFNKLIGQIWKYYESAICKSITETVEPLMMQYKPIFVSSIKFRKLTFGDAPFKITHVTVVRESVDELVLEMGVRWDGKAHVAIGVDVVGAGFITPTVKRLNFFANVRMALTRMVPVIPCFGAVLISFKSAPLVTFDLDCGPGIGEMIEAWLIPFLKNDILGNMLVWPNRIVVPLLPPDVLGPTDTLKLHTSGVLKVTVVEARNLPKMDITGKGDPFAILETVYLKPSQTKVVYNSDSPKWNETHFMKVQEVDQCLRVTVRDQESALVGAITFNHSELVGRTLVPLEHLVEGETAEDWYPLGKGDWGDMDGPGDGRGEIRLQLCYYSIKSLRSGQLRKHTEDRTPRGLVFLTVLEASNLRSDEINESDPYCVVWLDGTKKKTNTLKNTSNPVWNTSMDWYNVSALDKLYVEVYDQGKISDRLLGKANLSLLPIAQDFKSGATKTPSRIPLELGSGHGDVLIVVEWIPLDDNPIPIQNSLISRYRSMMEASETGVLFVRLYSGEDLKNVDVVGLSDPFVILKVGGSPKVSKYINNNLNPVWKETFSWTGVRETGVLHGEVRDKGTIKDKTLGTFKIGLSSLIADAGEVKDFTVPLVEKGSGNPVQGTVKLQLCWKLWSKGGEEDKEPESPEWPEFASEA